MYVCMYVLMCVCVLYVYMCILCMYGCAGPSGRSVYVVGLLPLSSVYYGFESHRWHGCRVVCCQIEVSATG